MNEHERLLTVRETADRLAVGVSTVRRKIREGTLPAIRLGPGGAAVRIDPSELQELLEKGRMT